MLVMSLKDPAVASVRRTHPLLRGTRVLGRGSFCVVFETAQTDRVLKLTTDRAHVDYLLDGCSPQGEHKPRVLADHEEVGTTSRGLPMYLLEVERLQRIKRGTPNGTLAQRIVRFADKHRHFPDELRDVPALTSALADFMGVLNIFISNFSYMRDAKFDNFMQRADGTLVFSDPVYDHSLFQKAHQWQTLC